jgi:AAA family ATP:ADP antiporter
MSSNPGGTLSRVLQRIVDVRDSEIRALILSGAYFFCILSAYYVIRPIRDEMGVAGGVRNLPWLFTGTLISMLILNPIFAGLVMRFSRRRFVSMTYRFFMANLVIFFVALNVLPEPYEIWIGRTLFVWTSVFNLFVVSIFWAFMADVFRTEQSKRLFGFIGVGGTLGGLFGAAITAFLVQRLGAANLLLISAMLLEMAVLFVRRLSDLFVNLRRARGTEADEERPIGGTMLAGFSHVARSPYLLGICGYMLMYTLASTTLYFHQAQIADQYFLDRAARTAFFAKLDFAVNGLAIVTQVFLTGRIIKALGVAATLALLPALCMVGFTAFGLVPTLAILVVFQVLRRAGEFAVARPTRETLYTVVSREDRYKAKSLIDTFVYRSGDQIAAWSYTLVAWMGLSMAAISFAVAPLAGVWLLIGLWLGRRQHSIERQQATGELELAGAATYGASS